MALPNRFRVIPVWFSAREQKREGLPSFLDLCRFLTQPPADWRGKKFIRSAREEGGDYKITLKGYKSPVYWPAARSFWDLGMLLSEQLNPKDWHYYQIPETRVTPDDVVLDCGAAEGLFSMIASSVCKKCYCVEPSPSFQPLLRKTFANTKNVEIVPVFLGNQIGETHMTEDWGSSRQTGDSVGPAIEVSTIDAMFFDRDASFSYLKADVEGAEIQLLEGARKSIAKYRPKIAITTYHDPLHAEQMKELLKTANPAYRFRVKGITGAGQPVMLHAW
jgi:FkbM family methyltransferase